MPIAPQYQRPAFGQVTSHRGYSDLQHSVNRNLPAALRTANRLQHAASLALRHPRRHR